MPHLVHYLMTVTLVFGSVSFSCSPVKVVAVVFSRFCHNVFRERTDTRRKEDLNISLSAALLRLHLCASLGHANLCKL